MKLLWLTWKDLQHPLAGGAEVVNEELAKRLTQDGHEVTFLVGGYTGGAPEETRDGFRIIRVGGRFSVYWHAYRYYKMHLQGWADLVVDEVNTIPFFAKYYVQEKNILFVHQLAREIWFYQMPFPVSLVGYVLEPLYLWALRDRTTITVSKSTQRDLMRYGFKKENIHIISEGIQVEPLKELSPKPVADSLLVTRNSCLTLLSLGAIRPMKRTLDIIKAFEIIRADTRYSTLATRNLRLVLAGDTTGKYAEKVLQYIEQSPFRADIEVLGHVSAEKKLNLMRNSHALAVTSVKEGWGLVVTEAASQGTPAVVYNVDGLRDSVQHRNTGLVCTKNMPEDLAANLVNLLTVPEFYDHLRTRAWEWSKEVTFERGYAEFKEILSI